MELVPKNTLAKRLGMTRKAVETLIGTGVVRETVTIGRNVYVPEEEAVRLEQVPFVEDPHEPALLVKVNAAQADDENGRPWMGWKAGVDPTEQAQMDGVRQYWQVRDPDRYVNNLLIPIAAGFVLSVYEVSTYSTLPGKVRSFEIKPAPKKRAKPFLNHRFPLRQGSFTDPR